MPRLVMKFGGTSVADLDRIRNAAAKVKREVERGYDVAVVVSAMAGKTNELVGWVRQTSQLYDAREYDAVVASGENVTAGLMALTLQEIGVPARSWQGWQVPLRTNSSHGAARIVGIETEGLIRKFGEGLHAVIAGFQGDQPGGADHHARPRRVGHHRGRLRGGARRPSAATSTPTSTGSIPPTRGSPARRASWSGSPTRRCWSWRPSGPRCCRPARSSSRCATRCGCRCCRASTTCRAPSSATRRRSWNRGWSAASPISRDEAKMTVHRRARPARASPRRCSARWPRPGSTST